MTHPSELTSPDNPRLKAAVKLREAKHRRRTGLFLAEGRREIERALAGGFVLREGFSCPALLGTDRYLPPGGDGAPWFTVTEPLLGKLAYRENPEGVVAVFEQRYTALSDLQFDPDRAPLVLVAAGVTKPGNLGAMLRSADAAGADAVILADAVVDLFNPNCIRASTGAVFTVPVAGDTATAVRTFLAERGIGLVVADPAAKAPHTQIDWTGPAAVAIGAEDSGFDPVWRGAADVVVRIPMYGRSVDSLNASVTAALLLFEARRQRSPGAGR